MSTLDYLLRFPWVEPLGWTLIHFLWQGALICIAAWTLLRLARRSPALRHTVAAGALALCVVLPAATFLLLARSWRQAPAATIPAGVLVNAPVATPALIPLLRPRGTIQSAHASTQKPARPANPPPAATPTFSLRAPWRVYMVRWIVPWWFAGVVILAARLAVGWARVQRWRGRAQPVTDTSLADRFLTLATRLKMDPRSVRLLVSRAVSLPGPVAIGLWQPVVLLPSRLLERLPLAQIEALLAHELAHVRRHDYLWNLLTSAVEVALFYHPAVWFLGRELRSSREECCDALAAAVFPDRLVYARALAAVAEERVSANSLPAPAAASGPLLQRVCRLLGLDVPPEPLFTGRNAGWAVALASVVLMAAGVLYSGKLMAQDDDPNIPTLVRPAPRGSVLDSNGQPVSGARVLLYHAVSYWGLGNQVEEVTADTGGQFAFSQPLRFKNPAARHDPAEYTLYAIAQGRAAAWAAVLPEAPEDRAFILTVTPPKPQTYEVVDRAGKPIEGATVWLRYAGKQMDRHPFFPESFIIPNDIGICHALTDASGRATLSDLPDSQISVTASKAGYEDEFGCTTPREGVPRFTLRPAAVLEGHVTDPLGRAVEGAVVSVYPKFRFHQYFLSRTDAEGRYRIDKIWSDRVAHPDQPDWGKYQVAVRHPRFTAATREVTFSSGQTITGFDLAVIPGTEIVGRLLDPATRAPVVGGRVYVDSGSGRQERDTDGTGTFRCRVVPGEITAAFIGTPRGSYVVIDDYAPDGPPISVRAQATGDSLAIELFLPGSLGRLGTVRGRLELPDGQPATLCEVVPVIDGNRIRLTDWSGNTLRGVQTDERGNFELPSMPVGLGFTLSGQTPDGRFRGTLASRLRKDSLDLPDPLILHGTLSAEVLLTDFAGQPRPNLAVTVVPQVAGKALWTQRRELRSGADGVLRLPDATPGGSYQVTVTGSRTAEATFVAPATGDAVPGVHPTLVLSEGWLVSLLGTDGKPIVIKEFRDFEVDLHQNGRVMKWTNGPLAITGRSGLDVVVPRETLILGKGSDTVRFLIEAQDGTLFRAEGSFPADGSGRIVAHVTENLPADTVPAPSIGKVDADEIAGRVVGPDGQPIPGVRAAFPALPYQKDDTAPVLSGDDGVFRLPMPARFRSAYLTLSKEGWGPIFLTAPPVGQGFCVVFQNTTRLRGKIGGERPGRVELLLEKNKFTPREGSLNHEVRDIRFRTATDEQGAYDFPMEPGKYRWTATSTDGRFARGEVSLDAGEVHDLGANLRRGNDVMLELHDIQTGQPVPGIEVCIMEKVGFASIANRPGSERTSDPGGRVRWENLLPGETQFEAWSLRPSPLPGRKQAPYGRWWVASKAPDHYASQPPTGGNGVNSLRANVDDDLSSPVRVLLERGVKISGSVVGPDGKGLGGVNVLLNTEHGGLTADMRMSTRTEADGSFLAYLPAGNGLAYQLCAAFPPWTEEVPAANAVSERFDSWPGDERTFHLVMGKGGWFTGRLATAEGNPTAGFKVTAVAVDGQDSVYAARIVTAGTNGGFRLGPLRPGKYKVFAGTGPGAPLRKLPGTKEITGEIVAEGDTRDLGLIDLPASAKLQQ